VDGPNTGAAFTNANMGLGPRLLYRAEDRAAAVGHVLIEPGTLYGDRVNEIDLRFAKTLRLGHSVLQPRFWKFSFQVDF
jgi:hypothetical protein